MFDETKLNHEYFDEQSQVESALRSLDKRETAIDQNQIMYQAGWAAAAAEFELDKPTTKATSRLWPSLALSFAATTAACLFLLLGPTIVGDSSVPIVKSTVAPESFDSSDERAVEEQRLVANSAEEPIEASAQSKPNHFQNLFGFSMNRFAGKRNAQIQRFAAEAASPTRMTFIDSQIDLDWEAPAPLTLRSIHAGAL